MQASVRSRVSRHVLIERASRRHLTFRMLAGIPEIEGTSGPQQLLRERIYNRVRHPRYLGLVIGLTGFTILVNHVGTYLFLMIFWVLLSFFSGFIARAVEAGWLPFMTSIQAGQLRFILVGVAIMLIVIFRPQGIFGNKKELAFVK